MLQQIYVLHGIQTPTTFYSQLEEASPTPGINAMLQGPAGAAWPNFRGIRSLKPEVSFRTSQLTTLLAQCPAGFASLAAGNTDLYYRAVTELGTRVADGTAVHKRLRIAKGFMHWTSLSARHQQEASASGRVVAIADGTHVPIVAAGTVALSGTPGAGQSFGLGPVTVNSVPLDGVQEMTVDLGITLYQVGGASLVYDTCVAVKEYNPVITLRGLDLSAWTTYGIAGTALTGLTAYLRALRSDADGAAYEADATAAHIKFVVGATGMVCVEPIQGTGSAEASDGLRIYLRGAPGTFPLTITTGETIA